MDLAKGKQKVKLFLCNRDIQVGDEFNNSEILNKKYIADVVNENDIECYKHDCYVPKRYCFKVIGEISPDALSYVIEGMEFDENQIKEVSYNRSIGDIKEWVERFIQIKGPCGHFH